eukprot:6337257-Karenia_brevis.AAC.1
MCGRMKLQLSYKGLAMEMWDCCFPLTAPREAILAKLHVESVRGGANSKIISFSLMDSSYDVG